MGWYLDAEGTGEKITMSTKVATAANHTLYAKWKEKTTNYTFDDPEMLEDWSKRNETNFNYEIANEEGNNMLKVTHNGTDKDNAWLVLWYNLVYRPIGNTIRSLMGLKHQHSLLPKVFHLVIQGLQIRDHCY